MTRNLLKLKKRLTDHDHDKCITTPEFNNLAAAKVFNSGLEKVPNRDFDDKLKVSIKNINSYKTKYFLVENELKRLQTFDWICFRGKSHFEEDGT